MTRLEDRHPCSLNELELALAMVDALMNDNRYRVEQLVYAQQRNYQWGEMTVPECRGKCPVHQPAVSGIVTTGLYGEPIINGI